MAIDPTTGLQTPNRLSTNIADVATNPSALSSGILPPQYNLPGSDAAASGLRNLQTGATGGLDTLVGNVSANPAAPDNPFQKAMYGLSSEAINREADLLSRNINEGTFGRGMGLSTWTGDLQQRLDRERLDALGRASQNAYLASGAEGRAQTASALDALRTAFGAGTSGLQAEATVPMTNAARQQQAATTATGEALGTFGQTRGLAQQQTLQEQAFQNALDIANRNMLSQGIGLGLSGLGSLFGPSITTGINNSLMDLFPTVFTPRTA